MRAYDESGLGVNGSLQPHLAASKTSGGHPMSPALMESLREQAAIHRFSTPTVTFTAATRVYVMRAAWDAWVLLVAGKYREARENLQFAADMLGGAPPEPEHAEGCRCPICDPDYNDPRNTEDMSEEDMSDYWRRELGAIARRYASTPDPRRAK